MKTIFITSLCLFFNTIIFSQYIPFPEENATWSMELDVWDGGNFNLDRRAGYVHETLGDTLINGLVYKKVYQRLTWWTQDYFEETDQGIIIDWFASGNYNEAPLLLGGMRQDSAARKVYFIRFIPNLYDIICIQPIDESILPINQEILLFDFDIEEGDTLYLNGPFTPQIIGNVDSVLLNDNLYHKRYQGLSFNYAFIEGLGSDAGLFAGIRGFFVEGEGCYLKCFNIDGQYLIGEEYFGCDSINTSVPVIEIDHASKIEIAPNPFDDFIQIDIQSTNSDEYQLKLFNVYGQLVIDDKLNTGNQQMVDTHGLTPGIYWLSIYNRGKLLGTQKIIKAYR